MKSIRTTLVVFFVLLIVFLSACVSPNSAPPPESDSGQSFQAGSEIPVDDTIYDLVGEVSADIQNLTEVKSEGNLSGANYSAFGYGYVSGSYSTWQEGKGFIRIKVISITPSTENSLHKGIAPVGKIIIIKTTDTKLRAVLPGDRINFKCRAQFESVAAIRQYETFDAKKLGTWELDYCRMADPIISQ